MANTDATDTDALEGTHEASTEGITLLDGEHMLENLRPSWEAWLWQILVGGFFFLIGLTQLVNGGIGISLLTGLVILVYVVIARWQSRYFVTDERAIQRAGLLRRSTNEVRIEDIEGLQTDARIIERILHHGHIILSSAATTDPVTFNYLANHNDVANHYPRTATRLDETHNDSQRYRPNPLFSRIESNGPLTVCWFYSE